MFKRMTMSLSLLAAFACGGVDQGGTYDQADQSARALISTGGLGVEGGACTVVGGPNTGKKGTYDSEGACCDEGPNGWGCTECHGSNAGKCKDGHVSVVRPRPPRVQVSGSVLGARR